MAYFLRGLIEDAGDDFPRAIKDELSDTEETSVVEYLRFMADQIEAD